MSLHQNRSIKLLFIEDNDEDVVLFREIMGGRQHPDIIFDRVPSLADAIAFLREYTPDLILLDLNLPDSRGIRTFEKLFEHATQAIIVLSGLNDEELAIEAVHKGAQDYLVKWEADRKTLTRSILYAIERHRLLKELEAAQREIQSLRNLIPICAYCKRVRHDDGYWQHLESYLSQVSNIDFSHGICPDCYTKLESDDMDGAQMPS